MCEKIENANFYIIFLQNNLEVALDWLMQGCSTEIMSMNSWKEASNQVLLITLPKHVFGVSDKKDAV